MTPEERAVKWFEKVPEADDLSFDQRLAICKKTGNAMALVFVARYDTCYVIHVIGEEDILIPLECF